MDQFVVEKIENGTVIDHIPAGMGLKVMAILKIGANSKVALLMNVPSRSSGQKDIVKISDRVLDEQEVNRIALAAPNATLNIIKNGAVFEKSKVRLPKEFRGVAKCPNPNCVSNHESIEARFTQGPKGKNWCAYCEMLFDSSELIF